MCGIAGIWDPRCPADELTRVARSMGQALLHRGPDDGDVWTSRASGLSLSHRRLAVVDLSPHGRQPMRSACGRYVIVYNGEIYNHLALREELQRLGATVSWRGRSDTEVVLASIAHWGLRAALQRFTGMFALAVWDEKARTLNLARDRLGEKPLYYGVIGNALVFASELKALRRYPGWRGEVDRASLDLLMRYSYVPAPRSIFVDIHKLVPGSLLSVSLDELDDVTALRGRLRQGTAIVAYWSAIEEAQRAMSLGSAGSTAEAEENLHDVLSAAVRGQMIADVPLGAFLSGGVDSSTVVALMQAQSARPVRTFTIGFHEDGYDEARYAHAVARHLGTHHTELYVTPADALELIPRLPAVYDEPFADSSQIPTLLLSRLTRAHVTVSLSGDGGDELFGGYNRYFWGGGLWRRIGDVPAPLRSLIAAAITAVPPVIWSGLARALRPVMPREARDGNVGDKLHKLAEVLPSKDPDSLYEALVSLWRKDQPVRGGLASHRVSNLSRKLAASVPSFEERMMLVDLLTYLPDDILVKLDRATMSVSLESRLPFLDHRVVEFAWRLPLEQKIRDNTGKRLLRRVLYRYVPRELIERPKRGFAIPLDSWLRGPLRNWAEELLHPARLRRDGFFQAEVVSRKWHEHLTGTRNWQHALWNVLVFQAWLEAERSTNGSSVQRVEPADRRTPAVS